MKSHCTVSLTLPESRLGLENQGLGDREGGMFSSLNAQFRRFRLFICFVSDFLRPTTSRRHVTQHSDGGSTGAESREKEEERRRKKERVKAEAQVCTNRSKAEVPFELPVTALVSERAQAKVPMKPGDWKHSTAALCIHCVICAKRQRCGPLSRSSNLHFRIELLAMG